MEKVMYISLIILFVDHFKCQAYKNNCCEIDLLHGYGTLYRLFYSRVICSILKALINMQN